MTTKADFTEDEWATLVRSPIVAGMAISIADPGGPIEMTHETSAVVKFALGTSAEGRSDLIGEVAADLKARLEEHKNPVGDFKPRGALAGKEVVDEVTRAGAIVRTKGTPDEAQAFAEWLMETAQRAANAAKEGGFMGFHAERVSQGEKDMLEQLGTALGVSPGEPEA